MLRLRLLRQVRPAVAVLYRSLLARRLRVAVAVCRSQVARRLVATVAPSLLVLATQLLARLDPYRSWQAMQRQLVVPCRFRLVAVLVPVAMHLLLLVRHHWALVAQS